MTIKEQAVTIIEGLHGSPIITFLWNDTNMYPKQELKRKAMFVVDEIEKALTRFGEDNLEIQNMDSTFRELEKLRMEILKL